jgi:hypothetical protein
MRTQEGNMRDADKLPEAIQSALSKGLLKRFPLTFLPFVNQQLDQWQNLFPNERKSVERLLVYVAGQTPEESAALFRDVVQLEEKMGVRHWEFSTKEQTILNSSQLARSQYFQEWRNAVQAVFDAADQHAVESGSLGVKTGNRLVLLHMPKSLPFEASSVWSRWRGIGRPINLDLGNAASSGNSFDLLLNGLPSATGRSTGLLDVAWSRAGTAPADTWVVDAGNGPVDSVLRQQPAAAQKAILLSNGRLEVYRQSFSREMNTMRKDLADADAVFDRLRKVDVTPWCPAEVAGAPATREFLRALYLTGNGAVIFGNSFVQWAAAEAFRRARPSFLAAQFGMRTKPKPFTGVAVFDNPELVNPLPPVDDPAGSAADVQMLALYVWLAAARFDEYQRSTVCVCVAENLSQGYVVAPPEFALGPASETVALDRLRDALHSWIE